MISFQLHNVLAESRAQRQKHVRGGESIEPGTMRQVRTGRGYLLIGARFRAQTDYKFNIVRLRAMHAGGAVAVPRVLRTS